MHIRFVTLSLHIYIYIYGYIRSIYTYIYIYIYIVNEPLTHFSFRDIPVEPPKLHLAGGLKYGSRNGPKFIKAPIVESRDPYYCHPRISHSSWPYEGNPSLQLQLLQEPSRGLMYLQKALVGSCFCKGLTQELSMRMYIYIYICLIYLSNTYIHTYIYVYNTAIGTYKTHGFGMLV